MLGNLLGAHVASGDSVSYVIDGANRRVIRRVNGGGQVSWMYTGGIFVAAELDSMGAVRNRYVYATTSQVPDLLVQGGTTYRLITDQLGSVRAVVNVTSGAVAQRLDYDAWGVLTTDTAPTFQSLGYAGGITDRSTGLVRFGARDYEPGVGRWTAKDPAGLGGGLDLYAYAFSSPLNWIDVEGAAPTSTSSSQPRITLDQILRLSACTGRTVRSSVDMGSGFWDAMKALAELNAYFEGMVASGNTLDLKRSSYTAGMDQVLREFAGNYNYGILGSAIGFPEWYLHLAAAYVDIKERGREPLLSMDRLQGLGDDAADYQAIVQGYARDKACGCKN